MQKIKYRIDINKLLPPNPVVCEIGVAEGYFSAHMAREWGASKVYCVDNWGTLPGTGDGAYPQDWHDKNYKTAVEKLRPFGDRIKILRGISSQMAGPVPDNSLDLLYLDGNHTYEGVKADLEAWFQKVKPGGVIAGHDYINPAYGVFQAVNEFAERKAYKVNIIHENSDPDAGFWFYKTK